jgi:hypothetical protein
MRALLPHALRGLPRGSDFGSLQETLLMTGVATVLVIRTQLWLTNYPQLGGHGLHIAHLLWGGLFMLVAIGLLLTFVGRGIPSPGRGARRHRVRVLHRRASVTRGRP